MESFSTVGVPLRRKMSYWSEVSSETFATMQIVPGDRERFEGRLYREVVDRLALAEVCSSAGSVNHTEAHVARAVSQRYVLVTPIAGGFEVLHGQQPGFELHAGEFCLLDEASPYRLLHKQPARTFCVVLEDGLLRDFIPEPARLGGVPVRPVSSMSRMLVSLLCNLSHEMESHRHETESHQVGTLTPAFAHALTGFIAAAYSEVAVAEESVLECRKRFIRRYVDMQLHNPQLAAADIAQHFGISERYLRLIFESDAESLSTYILHRRLENSARLLRDASWRRQTITDIALRSGFNNVSHFGFAFKRRFGVTPRDYRRMSTNDGD